MQLDRRSRLLPHASLPSALGPSALIFATLSGCAFGPVPLEGRRCQHTDDCIRGYVCAEDGICVVAVDAGRPDAGRPDASRPDASRLDAHLVDADLDALIPTKDAPFEDAMLEDAMLGAPVDASLDVRTVDDVSLDARADDDAASDTLPELFDAATDGA